jgi:hypothetical protein
MTNPLLRIPSSMIGSTANAVDPVSVVSYGADPTGTTDSSAAFTAALAASKCVYVPDGNYLIGDVTVPSGRKLYGNATFTSRLLLTTRPKLTKKSGTVTRMLNCTTGNDITIEGLLIDGSDNTPHGVAHGADNLTLRDVAIIKCNDGLGNGASSNSMTTFVYNCYIGQNIRGIRCPVDMTVIGGSITSNYTHGIDCQSGNDFNKFMTRVEWNGNGNSGAYTEGWNINMFQCKNNMLFCDVDAGYLGGVRLVEAQYIVGTLNLRRNGRKDSGTAQQDCHVLLQDSKYISLSVISKTGTNDDGSGATTPKYTLSFHGTGSGPTDSVHVLGDLSGAVTSNTVSTGTTATNVFLGRGSEMATIGAALDATADYFTVFDASVNGLRKIFPYQFTGHVIDRQATTYSSNADLNTTFTRADSVPPITEGTSIGSVVITPKSTTSVIRVRLNAVASASAAKHAIAALFVNGATNSVKVTESYIPAADVGVPLTLEYSYVPGSTSAQTIQVRVGANSGAMRLNGTSAARLYGGVEKATIEVEEISA